MYGGEREASRRKQIAVFGFGALAAPGHDEHIQVGNLTNNVGVAIGHGAQAIVNQGVGTDELAKLFATIYDSIDARPADPKVDKDEIKEKVQRMAQKGKHSHRTLHQGRWYTPETWSARHRKVGA